MENKFSNKAKGGIVLFVVFTVIFAWISFSGSSSSALTVTHVGVGEQGFLEASTTVGISKDSYDAVFKALSANDADGFYQLEGAGKAFELKARTQVLVIDSSWGVDEIRFIDGTHAGETGWVNGETVKSK